MHSQPSFPHRLLQAVQSPDVVGASGVVPADQDEAGGLDDGERRMGFAEEGKGFDG